MVANLLFLKTRTSVFLIPGSLRIRLRARNDHANIQKVCGFIADNSVDMAFSTAILFYQYTCAPMFFLILLGREPTME
jgi:hypothetical protein